METQGDTADRLTRRLPTGLTEPDGTQAIAQVRRIVIVGLSVTIAMVALQAATQMVNFGFFDLRFHVLDCDYHLSVFGVASLLAEAAAGATIAWRGRRLGEHRRVCRGLGLLVAGLVVLRTLTTFNAAVLAAPLAYVFGMVLWVTWRDRFATRAVVWTALILMVVSLLLHKVGIASDASTASDYTWTYQFTDAVKHGCELAGWMLLAVGTIAGVADRSVASVDAPAAAEQRRLADDPTPAGLHPARLAGR